MGDITDFPPCSRSQTVPNMSTLSQDEERDITTPDSLLSDTKETDLRSVPDSPITFSKTPDSALMSEQFNLIKPNNTNTGSSLHIRKSGRVSGLAWQNSSDQADDINVAWNGMMENENDAVRDRLADLEKKVHQQNDEIVCLKATLADCLRRLNTLEVDKDHVEICTTPTRNIQPQQPSPGGQNGFSKIPLRRPLSASTRRISYSSDTDRERPRTGGSNIRRSMVYHSNTSINSDMSSTPTQYTNPQTNNNNVSSRVSTSTTPRLFTPSSNSSSGHRKMNKSMGKLHKKWRSTSDFDPAPALSVYRKSTAGTGYGSSLSFRSGCSPYSSQLNIDSSNRNVREVSKCPQYSEEEGILRIFIRNRAVSLLCPGVEREDYNPDKIIPAPSQKLKLEWVYGYRGRDARCEMIYFVSSVVVLYNTEEQSQRHYLAHTEDVKCLALHPNKTTVATGQGPGYYRREGQPHIRVWNTVSLQTLAVLGMGDFKRAVSSLSFSRTDGGTYLVSVDDTPDHLLSVWDWARGVKQIESKCTSEMVVSAEFHPMEDGCIVSCGKGHVNFWQIDPSYSSISRKTGVLDPRDKPKYFTSLAFSCTGDVITGDSNGNMFIWGRGYNAVTKAMWKVHDGPIFTICVLKDGSIVTGGGKDGRLVRYDSNFMATGREAQLPDHLGGIRTVSQGHGAQLLVGTTRNSILTGNLDLSFQEVMVGHQEEVSALASRPSQSQFLTAGHDRMLHLWDSLSHSIVWSNDVGEQVQSACFSCDGEVVVVGTVTGKWVVLDSRTKEVHGVHQDGAEPIHCVKFSPDGAKLAISSRVAIHVYRVEEEYTRYTRVGRCLAQTSFLNQFDWSEDSQYIQANNADREVLVMTTSLCRIVTETEILRDLQWSTSDCLVSWANAGIWTSEAAGTTVTSAARSNEADLLVVGDDGGHVSLYQHPASQPTCARHVYSGHSSEVTRVTFLADDTRLVSVGGKDCAIMQWEVL